MSSLRQIWSRTRSCQRAAETRLWTSMSLIVLAVAITLIITIQQTTPVDGFIKFGYILNTTACDTCDELRTYSGRNVFCCLAQSKCCGPNSLDELDALTTTTAP